MVSHGSETPMMIKPHEQKLHREEELALQAKEKESEDQLAKIRRMAVKIATSGA